MIHAYHVIFGAYGFWLPNDPRGSWSDFVGAWELRRFGPATKGILRKPQLSFAEQELLDSAKSHLEYPPVEFTGIQARAIGRGFARAVAASRIVVWACSILPHHVHLVIARHWLRVEQIARLMKGAATKRLNREGLHPLKRFASDGEIPSPWAVGRWRVYLDTEEAIENAIRYVEQNPIKEGMLPQRWSFVQPFCGLEKGWITYH